MELVLGDVFRNAARAVPHRPAAMLGDRTLTFGEIDLASNRVARVLAGRGVGRGDRVAVWATTSLDLVPVFVALAKLGAVFVPFNGALSAAEIESSVEIARPMLVIAESDAELGLPTATFAAIADGALRESSADDRSPVGERDPHVVFFTSGSTGRPKGAVISHRANFLRTHPGALLEARGAKVCPYPLFHMAAWTIALQQWQARAATVFVERADAPAICEALERHQADRINCIPGVWRRILEYLGGRELPWVAHADTGTSATPLELLEAIMAAAPNAEVRVFYGSTEAGSVASLAHAEIRRKPGSCGLPAPWTEVRVADDGELWARGPLLFDGYFEDAEANARALADGWYRSGDVVDVDEDGYLRVVGRAGDVIRTGGEAVAPVEVEAVLADHPDIADVAIIGLPDAQWGEVVCAVVVPRSGRPTLEDVRRFCAGRLAAFKHPRRLELVESVPRTPATNQIQRRLLVERFS